MSENFLQAMKWYVLVFFTIVGTSAFIISDKTGSMHPVSIGIFAFGVVYIMSYFWKEFRRKVLMLSIIIFLGLTLASPYTPTVGFILFGMDPNWFDVYYTWAGTMLFGIPMMMWVFHKYD